MAHKSESSKPLAVRRLNVSSIAELPTPSAQTAEVWFLVLPFGRTTADAEASGPWFDALRRFTEELNEQSVLAILTSMEDAAETWLQVSHIMQFQLLVAVKLGTPLARATEQLPQHHAALLILSKYRASLRHTKTRIGYSYCPYCDKTTKDYGGKKHTYHEYGTLLSDVWRDISYSPGKEPVEIATRLADLFGLAPYRSMFVASLASVPQLSSLVRTRRKNWSADRVESRRHLISHLILGDCLAELRKLPSNSVDFCFADPPYNLAKRYDSWDDAIDVKDYLKWCDTWIDELIRILRPGRTCAILNIPILAIRHFQHMKQELDSQYWIAWEGLSLPVRMIMPAHYAIVCFSKGDPRPLPAIKRDSTMTHEACALMTFRENYCVRQSCIARRQRVGIPDRELITDLWWDIHRLKHNSRRVDHPCQLPPALMRRLISMFTYKGEVVVDPFNGAGTTTLCAEELGRRYVGIELSEKYHALAESRHKLLRNGHDPFAKTIGIPKAKNSRVRRIGGVKYSVPKKTLQLEVKRIAQILGRLPLREELAIHSKYPIQYYDEYFVSWGEVCAAARTTGMSEIRTAKKTAGVRQATLWGD